MIRALRAQVARAGQERAALESSIKTLGSKLQAALREEVGLVERMQRLEADATDVRGQLETALSSEGAVAVRLAASESARAELDAGLQTCRRQLAAAQAAADTAGASAGRVGELEQRAAELQAALDERERDAGLWTEREAALSARVDSLAVEVYLVLTFSTF